MTRIQVAAIILGAVSCARPYSASAGGPAKLDVAGVYATEATMYSTTCRGIVARNGQTKVQHTPGSAALKLVHNERPFDGTIRADGNFVTAAASIPSGTGTETTIITGRFTADAFYARVNVKIGYPSSCEYQLRWSGIKQ